MNRLVLACCLLSLFLCSVGCRMCSTPHDYRITGYIDRCEDYRGFDPLYRAGSILQYDACQAVVGNAYYVGQVGDYYSNAGNYGITTSVLPAVHRSPVGSAFDTRPGGGVLGIPPYDPNQGNEEIIVEPPKGNGQVPGLEDLFNRPRGGLQIPQNSVPVVPPSLPRVVTPSSDGDAPIPFSPNDAIAPPIIPPNTFPTHTESDPPITLEELRRLDPSIQDLQIISIEDAGVESLLK